MRPAPLPCAAVTFRPQALGAGGGSGEVDYRLARMAVVKQFQKGRLARHEVCDAHPELVRAARQLGEPTDQVCPICEDAQLVHVRYVFGPRLPSSGRCISTAKELGKLARQAGPMACYVVEVCPGCSWHHLTRTYPLGRATARRADGGSEGARRP